MGRATLRDIGRRAGVDPSTVSRVLRDDPAAKVQPATRERILAAAKALSYRPDAVARSLRTRRTRTVALLGPPLDNFGFADVVQGALAAARARDYLLLLGDLAGGGAAQQPPMFDGRVDGLLVAFGHLHDPVVSSLRGQGLPMVVVNRRVQGSHGSVVVDDAAGSVLAVEHLVELGHERIGHVAGAPGMDTTVRRQRAYKQAMRAAGLTVGRGWVLSGQFSEEGGRLAAQALLELPEGRRPTALYVANLYCAIGVLAALRDAGVAVPQDVSIVAMDDHSFANHTSPPLTTIAMPLFEMGQVAMDMLAEAIEGGLTRDVMLDTLPRIVPRRSSTPPSTA